MNESAPFPKRGLVAYFGPALTHAASVAIEAAGLRLAAIPTDRPDTELPKGAQAFVYGLGLEHPVRAALQRDAVGKGIPVFSDLAALAVVNTRVKVRPATTVLVTGSAGKSTTAALLARLLAQGGRDSALADPGRGYLNLLGEKAEIGILQAAPSALRDARSLKPEIAAVLNLSEERGVLVGDKARDAARTLLLETEFSVLGADDIGTQRLMMAVRRDTIRNARNVLPISGGATLSDGWFAIDRVLYAVRNGRTRRVAPFTDSAVLIGDHLGQDAAAAAAIANHFGVSDEQVGEGLRAFRGLPGRFDCIGADGRIVFVDDRSAECRASTAAALAACPDVFWIGHAHGELTRRAKLALRGSFILTAPDGSGPPVDSVVTFQDAEDAAAAALQAAQDLLRREPDAAPVLLFSPGAPGFKRQGEFFRLKALRQISSGGRAHA